MVLLSVIYLSNTDVHSDFYHLNLILSSFGPFVLTKQTHCEETCWQEVFIYRPRVISSKAIPVYLCRSLPELLD